MVDFATIGIKADTTDLDKVERKLGSVGREGEKTERKLKDSMKGAEGGAKSLHATVGKLGGALAAIGLGVSFAQITRSFYQANVESQRLKASLLTMTGSLDNASAAWSILEDLATRTPFQMEQTVNAFIKMKALGLKPTEEAILSFANTASAMGKDLNQMVEAVADATTGEFERLKEFGIKASQEGENVKLTFQGVTTEIGKNSKEIQSYLENIGNTTFAGAVDVQMATIGGSMSNLQDNVDKLFRAMGGAGGNAGLSAAINGVSDAIATLTGSIENLDESFYGPLAKVQEFALKLGAIKAELDSFDDGENRGVFWDVFMGKTPAGFLWERKDALYKYFGFGGKAELAESKDNILDAFAKIDQKMNSDLLERLMVPTRKLTREIRTLGEIAGDAGEEIEKFTDLTDKQADALYKLIDGETIAAELARQELEARQKGTAALEAFNRYKFIEAEVRRATGDLSSLEIALLREEAAARYDAEKALEDYVDDQDKLAKAAEKAAEESARTWEEATNRIDEAFADMWAGAFDSFGDFADRLKDAFVQLLAELAHRATTQKILISLGLGGGSAGALAGGGGAGGGGFNLSSLLSGGGALAGINSTLLTGAHYIGGGLANLGLEGAANFFGSGVSNLAGMPGGLAGGIGLSLGAGIAGNFAGNALGGGLFGKQAESNIGASIGGTIGALTPLGPLGAFIGSTIGAMLDVAFGGDGKKRVGLGVETMVGAGSRADLRKYGTDYSVTAASGLELTSFAQRAGDEGKEAARSMVDAFAYIDGALTSVAGALGIDVNLSGQSLSGKSSGKGSEAPNTFFGSAEYNEINQDALTGAADEFVRAWVDKVNEVTGSDLDLEPIFGLAAEGELLADTLIRVNNEFGAANAMLGALGMTLLDTSVAGMAAADGLVQAFGGLENMTAANQVYYEKFFTSEEKIAKVSEQLLEIFGELGVAMPATNMEFRALVESFDPMTTEGQKAIAALISVSGAFDLVTSAAGAAGAAIVSLEDVVGGLLGDLAEAVGAEKDALTAAHNTRLETLQGERDALVNGTADARSAIDTAFEGLQRWGDQERDKANATADGQLAALTRQQAAIQSTYAATAEAVADSLGPINDRIRDLSATAKLLQGALNGLRVDSIQYDHYRRARALGRLQAGGLSGDALKSNLSDATNIDPREFATFTDYASTVGKTRATIGGMLDGTNSELDIQEAALAAAEDRLAQADRHQGEALSGVAAQIAAIEASREAALNGIDEQIKRAEDQIDALAGVDNNVVTLTDVTRLISTYEQTKALNDERIAAIDEQIAEETAFYQDQIDLLDAGLEWAERQYDELRGITRNTESSAGLLRDIALALGVELPAFASGGYHSGGLAMVGENGPEIVRMGPSQIFNANDTAGMLSGGQTAALLRRLIDSVESGNFAIAKHTKDIRELNKKADGWNSVGLLTRTA